MYLDHYRLNKNPFPILPDSHIFFPGGGREKVLQHILNDLSRGMALVHLGGEKGSGKTLLCNQIREKIDVTKTVVILSEPLASFDEIGRNLAMALGENDAQNLTGVELYEKILQLTAKFVENGGSILLILDDAEKFTPTELEHILSLACFAQSQGRVQFVLAGRLTLGANPEQFLAIRSEPLSQFTYTLQPLNREDTARYLAFRLGTAGLQDDKKDTVFAPEAVARIYESSYGNIRQIGRAHV
jgi:type II secretory pathway predicted ATPase ExeA